MSIAARLKDFAVYSASLVIDAVFLLGWYFAFRFVDARIMQTETIEALSSGSVTVLRSAFGILTIVPVATFLIADLLAISSDLRRGGGG